MRRFPRTGVVTRRPPTDWEHADTARFTFVGDVAKATHLVYDVNR